MKKLLLAALVFAGFAVSNLDAQEKHHLVLEQFTTENCGYCPGSIPTITGAINSMTDTAQISWISHHAGFGTDFLTVPESAELTLLYRIGNSGTFAPAFMLNRTKFGGKVVQGVTAAKIKQIATSVMNKPEQVIAALADTDMSYDVASRTLKVKLSAVVTEAYTGGEDLYLNVALTEDNVKAKNQSGAGPNYIHNHVLRKLLGGAKGMKVDPTNAVAEFEFVLPAAWKIEDMKVITMAHHGIGSASALPADPSVYSSREYPFPHTGTSISSVADQSMKVYALNGELVIEGDYLSAKVYDLNGRLMPKARLNAGIYVVSVETHTGVYNHKVVVE